ncbi:hypothetical protein DICVIV_13048 [Dictyocaulus viviparus]|uniref:Rad21/Rec8-like protein C-terminal eukaryotic domain-containing protein n=1 Tax=Dictyocaulus viviparus TaxID=29172 RepID=A0A0D8XBF5_DICVI|nr:hypothetical protein DICVIV_13048 [Dictyocaulus viviparus]
MMARERKSVPMDALFSDSNYGDDFEDIGPVLFDPIGSESPTTMVAELHSSLEESPTKDNEDVFYQLSEKRKRKSDASFTIISLMYLNLLLRRQHMDIFQIPSKIEEFSIYQDGICCYVPATDIIDRSSANGESEKSKYGRGVEEDEGVEGDEDHRWSKRTQNVLNSIVTKLRLTGECQISLNDLLTKGATRKTAAQKFYTLLVLKKSQAIAVEQHGPYEDIFISAGPNIAQIVGK